MAIFVQFLSDTECEVTLTPNWLGRLFREPTRKATAIRGERDRYDHDRMAQDPDLEGDGIDWFWKRTQRRVEREVYYAIEKTPVAPIPKALLKEPNA